VKALLEIGIQPDILLCRSKKPLSDPMKKKIALFTNVEAQAVISAYEIQTTIYEIPLSFSKQNLDRIVLEKLHMDAGPAELVQWRTMVESYIGAEHQVRIGIVGKYLDLHDSYKSIFEALVHGGFANDCRIKLVKIDSEVLEHEGALDRHFSDIHGVLVPGGFGQRGIEGMIRAAGFTKTHRIPCFGICLGMQVMVIEHARTCLNLSDANSTEFDPDTANPVIDLLEEQVDITLLGGTMRLGASESRLKEGSKIQEIYGSETIYERHRHRYEVSNRYRDALGDSGMIIGGLTQDASLVESVEWADHPWGIGVQFHPEFKSKPDAAHPLFKSFVRACMNNGNGQKSS